jgi:hypothetical protein
MDPTTFDRAEKHAVARRPLRPAVVRCMAFIVFAAMSSGCWWGRRGPDHRQEYRHEEHHEDHRR